MNMLSSNVQPARQTISEASAWFADFRAGELDAAKRDMFVSWLRRSPEHIQAYLEVAEAWAELPARDAKGSIDVEVWVRRACEDQDVLAWERAAVESIREESPIRKFRWPLVAGVVLCLGAALCAGLFMQRRPVYETQVGEQRSIALPDGSWMELNARSRVRVRFDGARRSIDLMRGQALFRVAKDIQRPFVVHSDGARVRALGTEFDVYRKPSGTVVTVLEGKVAVSSTEAALEQTSSATIVAAGEQAVVTAANIAKPQRPDTLAATAWTQKQLMFEATPLAEVAEEFNRYNPRPLVVVDPQLRTLAISGLYSSTNPASLIRFLRAQPLIQVTESSAEITVERRSGK